MFKNDSSQPNARYETHFSLKLMFNIKHNFVDNAQIFISDQRKIKNNQKFNCCQNFVLGIPLKI